jgi:hypothetical protein
MKSSLFAVVAILAVSLPGQSIAQDATAQTAPEDVACADLVGTETASAQEIAALNDTSVVTVLRCREEAGAVAEDAGVADLRTAAAANPSLAQALTAAGSNPEQVVAVRRGQNGEFAFYVIGGYR